MKYHQPQWHKDLSDELREACKAFTGKQFPDAWLYLGENEEDWYDSDALLLGLPVYHCPAFLTHSGHDGEQQKIIPLWHGDVSGKYAMIREFECRLAKSGDY